MEVNKLEQLRQAVAAEDWIAAASTCSGMKLDRRDPFARFRADELAKAIRQHNALLVTEIIAGLGYPPATASSS